MKNKYIHPDVIQPAGIALALLLLGSLQGCMFYYKVQPVSKVTPQEVIKFDSQDKYIILHQGDQAWHLSEPLISDNTVYGKLSALPENRYKFLTTKPHRGNRYFKNQNTNESYVLEEVHLYIPDGVIPEKYDSGYSKIAFSKIQNAEVYVKAKGRTIASWLVPAIAGPVLVGSVCGIVVAGSMGNMHINLSH